MEILSWIDKHLTAINQTLLFGRYFDSISLDSVDQTYYLFNPHEGIDIVLTESLIIKAIHLFSGAQKSTKQFTGELPFNISFKNSQIQTRTSFGEPYQSGGGPYSTFLGDIPFWDKYKHPNFYLHLQFSDNKDRIDLVTIGSLIEY